mmetsp:Transcript_85456/g.227863  ORF Transcript_85456/g.227863 Transcript_85456/m.227863 type:complete len:170 (-) Transcript_85456:77-586(-)
MSFNLDLHHNQRDAAHAMATDAELWRMIAMAAATRRNEGGTQSLAGSQELNFRDLTQVLQREFASSHCGRLHTAIGSGTYSSTSTLLSDSLTAEDSLPSQSQFVTSLSTQSPVNQSMARAASTSQGQGPVFTPDWQSWKLPMHNVIAPAEEELEEFSLGSGWPGASTSS